MAKDIEVRHLLLDCKYAGIDIELNGSSLQVRGGKNRTDLYSQLKERKSDIVDAMSNLPEAVETYYLSRLRAGQEWMDECMKRIEINSENEKLINALCSYMVKWQVYDDEMRRLYPEYRGCPLEHLGGCNFAYTPVKCQSCVENNHDN